MSLTITAALRRWHAVCPQWLSAGLLAHSHMSFMWMQDVKHADHAHAEQRLKASTSVHLCTWIKPSSFFQNDWQGVWPAAMCRPCSVGSRDHVNSTIDCLLPRTLLLVKSAVATAH
jgi:hypothetical protein